MKAEGEKDGAIDSSISEPAAEGAEGPDPARQLAEKEAEIESLKTAHDALNNRFLRAQADFENFKRRTNKEKADSRKFRAQSLVTDLLDVLDNFKRALSVDTPSGASGDAGAFQQGMEMVLHKLEDALKKEGVEEIAALGQPFDPNLHQAVVQAESEEYDEGFVIEVFQAGYTLNGRVIRPAMVKVSA
ncbi:nucleotide exchange factor GrpE [Terrilactibacillus sp. S3-3]|nr:nucleotide exchange factor GrpE [Terrilactibacillus sp. S3-3]